LYGRRSFEERKERTMKISTTEVFQKVPVQGAQIRPIHVREDAGFDASRHPNFQAWKALMRTWIPAVWLSLALALFLASGFAAAQALRPSDPFQQKIQAAQLAAAENARQLREYQWIETATVTVNGSPKPPKQSLCHFGPDGKISKTPIGAAQETPQLSGGPLKRRIEKKKIAEVHEEFSEIGDLSALYLPLNPALLKQAFEIRRVELEHDGTRGGDTIVIHDYAKPGDQLILSLDGAMSRVQQIAVKTYLSSPSAPVSITVRFSSLPDGTSYPSLTALDAPEQKLSMTTVSADFSRAVPGA
jgi:hypothetical protein